MFTRFLCVRQTDGSDCGAAALATIARCHGRQFGLETLRELAGTDRVGTNLMGLVRAAERIGFSATAVKAPYEALSEAPLPAIAHVTLEGDFGHFVVLHQVKRSGVVVADPARGVVKLSKDQFLKQWSGHLVLLTPEADAAGPEVATGQRPLSRFLGMLRAHRPLMVEAVACALLMTLLGVSTSYFVQHLVDSVLVRGESRLLNGLGFGIAAVVVFRTLFGVLRHYLLAYIGRKVDLTLVAGYARHILSLPMNFFEMRQIGEIVSRSNDAGKVREAISGAALTVVVDGIVVVFTTSLLWSYDIPLAIASTVIAAIMAVIMLLHHPATRRRSRDVMEESAQLTSHQVEDIAGVETIKAYGAERRRQEAGERRLVRVVQANFAQQKLAISMNAWSGLISAMGGVCILWYGGHRVIAGALTIGELMFFYTLLGCMLDPLERLAGVTQQIQDALVAIDRLYQVLDLAGEDHDPRKARFTGIAKGLELRDVSFRYGCRDNVLKGVNLTVPAGATVAIVGESGCGKSTLLKLLTRFYDPAAGQVLVDGSDLRDFDLASLRQGIGVVSQEPFILNGTLRENIALGKPDATLNEIIAATRAAGLENFINRLPERYDTLVGERGANLSGGERQRLAIARALLRQPALLIFDEATSHLDANTERAIQENLHRVFDGRTVLIVAHRLSTVRDADLIYVMHEGQVVEQGTHERLLALGGHYARLCRTQTDDGGALVNPIRSYNSAECGTFPVAV
jgi:HlyB family type I secretion system ABC transporter